MQSSEIFSFKSVKNGQNENYLFEKKLFLCKVGQFNIFISPVSMVICYRLCVYMCKVGSRFLVMCVIAVWGVYLLLQK